MFSRPVLRVIVQGLKYLAVGLLVAAAGVANWLHTAPVAAPASEGRATDEVMAEWSRYARQVPLPQDQIIDVPAQVVELMNAHSAAAFRGRKIRFVLWQPGDAPVPGYQLNPYLEDPKTRDDYIDLMRHSPDYWRERALLMPELPLPPAIPGLVESPPDQSTAAGPSRGNTLDEQTSMYLMLHRYRTCLAGDQIFVLR